MKSLIANTTKYFRRIFVMTKMFIWTMNHSIDGKKKYLNEKQIYHKMPRIVPFSREQKQAKTKFTQIENEKTKYE